ncbi:MAG: potassium channel family protein [Pyrinomonadaceae bacterium]
MNNLRKAITRATDSLTEIIIYYLVVLTLSGSLFSYFEGKPWFDSMWWAAVTGLTIGYGDMFPVTIGGKLVALFLMHVVPLVIIPLVVAHLLTHVIEDRDQFTHEEQEQIKNDLKIIKNALGLKDDGAAE